MPDNTHKKHAVIRLKRLLQVGDQRELARRLETYPARVSDAFDGFVKDPVFLDRLQAAIIQLLEEREEVAKK